MPEENRLDLPLRFCGSVGNFSTIKPLKLRASHKTSRTLYCSGNMYASICFYIAMS